MKKSSVLFILLFFLTVLYIQNVTAETTGSNIVAESYNVSSSDISKISGFLKQCAYRFFEASSVILVWGAEIWHEYRETASVDWGKAFLILYVIITAQVCARNVGQLLSDKWGIDTSAEGTSWKELCVSLFSCAVFATIVYLFIYYLGGYQTKTELINNILGWLIFDFMYFFAINFSLGILKPYLFADWFIEHVLPWYARHISRAKTKTTDTRLGEITHPAGWAHAFRYWSNNAKEAFIIKKTIQGTLTISTQAFALVMTFGGIYLVYMALDFTIKRLYG